MALDVFYGIKVTGRSYALIVMLVTFSMVRASQIWGWSLAPPRKRLQDLERSSRKPLIELPQVTLTHQTTCVQLNFFAPVATVRSESTESKYGPKFHQLVTGGGLVLDLSPHGCPGWQAASMSHD
jgi:hypothetical protein